jgi:hypothetical protein
VLLYKGFRWRQKENPPVVFEAFSDDEQRYDGFAKPGSTIIVEARVADSASAS